MSELSHKTKKRKHATEANGEPTPKRSKKDGTSKDAKRKEQKKDKGKARAASGEFKVLNATMSVSIPPVFANNLRTGAEEMLDSMVMRYIPALQGVVLAHDSLQFIDSTATIKADCPFANCRIAFATTVWSPRVGMKLVGKVNLCSPDHVSLLVHRTFNVSIPRHHIPRDQWEFEYGPAENDPEFGAGVEEGEGEGGEEEAKEVTEEKVEGGGRWVHKLTGDRLGGPDGHLEFTVVGLTIANQMLSLLGSIQHDPFSPDHVPERAILTTTTNKTRDIPPTTSMQEVEMLIDGVDEDSDAELPSSSQITSTLARQQPSTEKAALKEDANVEKEEAPKKKEKKRKRSEKKDSEEFKDKKKHEGKKRKKTS